VRAHRTDIVSLGFGLVFVALAAWWLLAQLLDLALPPVGWFLAGGLILIGVLGLTGALRSARGGRAADGPPAVEDRPETVEPRREAVEDRPDAVEDRPVSGSPAPRWSPTDPLDPLHEEPTVPLPATEARPPREREGRDG
jgi:hypothetical protein